MATNPTNEPSVGGGFSPIAHSKVPLDDIRQFLDYEAELLDDPRRIRAWFVLLTDDFVYEVPSRVQRDSQSSEPIFPRESLQIYEDKISIERRVRRLESGVAWGEDPPALLRRVVGGVRASPKSESDFEVRSAFLLYHNRRTIDGDIIAGQRIDTVRLNNARFFLAHRVVLLDHIVIPTPNITFFM
jgi:3-phenylpropionate/cinnamic acid dioxygenase small subunit